MKLDFSAEEIEQLQRIVRHYFMDLRAEIYHTDSSIFKDGLKQEQAQLQSLLEKLEGALPAPK